MKADIPNTALLNLNDKRHSIVIIAVSHDDETRKKNQAILLQSLHATKSRSEIINQNYAISLDEVFIDVNLLLFTLVVLNLEYGKSERAQWESLCLGTYTLLETINQSSEKVPTICTNTHRAWINTSYFNIDVKGIFKILLSFHPRFCNICIRTMTLQLK